VIVSRSSPFSTVGRNGQSVHELVWARDLKAGVIRGGRRLRPTSATLGASARQDGRSALAGPYAETQELLGGFCLIDVPDLDAAIDWATKVPAASTTPSRSGRSGRPAPVFRADVRAGRNRAGPRVIEASGI
jgi:hypothetical protein